MFKNAPVLILLLLVLHFSIMSCGAFRPLESPVTIIPEDELDPIEAPVTKVPKPKEDPVVETPEPIKEKAEPKEEDALRQGVVDYAQQFVGTGYKAAGKDPKGFDCSGFTGYVMGHFGIKLSASSSYQEADGKPIPVSEVLPGDLIFFRRDKNGPVFHVSLVISNDQDGLIVVHSTSGRGVVIDDIRKSSYWSSKYATACRVIKP